MIRQNALVKFDYSDMNEHLKEKYVKIFGYDKVYIFLGEIPQMPGHCIVVSMNEGKILTGYHTENFIELTEEEC